MKVVTLLVALLTLAIVGPAAAQVVVPPQTLTLMDAAISVTVTAQVTSTVAPRAAADSLGIYAIFTRAAGGATAKAWVQTSFDGGTTWMDIASFAFTTSSADRAYNLTRAAVTSIATPTDGTLTDNTAVNGFLGGVFRVKYSIVGGTNGTPYTGSFKIYAVPN